MATNTTQRIATARDLPYVLKLQKTFNEQLGFIPKAAAAARIKQRQVVIAIENNEPAGFLLGAQCLAAARQVRPIFQAAIQFDAQRRKHGLALVELLALAAKSSGQQIIQCFCREELDANSFWKAAGFIAVARRDTNAVRGRACILWRKPLCIITPEQLSAEPSKHRHQSGGGRSVRRHDWRKLPLLDYFSPADLQLHLERLNLAA